MSGSGRAGVTHCGAWTSTVPEDCDQTRLVCNRSAGHDGPHQSPAGWAWKHGGRPRWRRTFDETTEPEGTPDADT